MQTVHGKSTESENGTCKINSMFVSHSIENGTKKINSMLFIIQVQTLHGKSTVCENGTWKINSMLFELANIFC